MKTARSLNLHQLITLFMLSSGLMDHVIVMPFLLGLSGRNGWISALAVGLLLTCWLPLLLYVMKKTQLQPLLPWIKYKYGRWTAYALKLPVAVFLFTLGTVTLIDTAGWVRTMFLLETPQWFIVLSLMGVIVWAACSGLNVIARCGIFLLPLVAAFGIYISVANGPRKHYAYVLPMLENGLTPVWKGMFIVGGGLVELSLILLLQHHLLRQPKLRHLLFILWVLVGLTIGPLLGALAEFGPTEAAHLRYPAYEEWRLIHIGHYIEHLDFLSIFQWLSGSFVRIAFALLLLQEVLVSHRSTKLKKSAVIVTAAALMIVLSLMPITDKNFVAFLSTWYFTGAIAVCVGFSLVAALLAALPKREGGRSS